MTDSDKSAPMGSASFIEIGADNASGIGPFFAQLFGWTFHAMQDDGMGWFDSPTMKIGVHGDDPSNAMVPYFRVENIEAAIARLKELGGSAEDKIAEEEGFGRFCNCATPEGVRFGLHEMM